MKIIVFGARGTSPVCGNEFIKYGGNTTCYLIEHNNSAIILDAGTGFVNASEYIINKGIKKVYLLFTHAHADHIQGLGVGRISYGFVDPLNLYMPRFVNKVLKRYYNKVIDPFPVKFKRSKDSNLRNINYKINFIKPYKDFFIEGIKITPIPFIHRGFGNVIIYKFNFKIPFVFSTDIEFDYLDISKQLDEKKRKEVIENYKEIIKGSIVAVDAMYIKDEYKKVAGFGHAYLEQVVEITKDAKLTLITHHSPFRKDKEIDKLYELVKKERNNVIFAREGMVIEI